MTNAQYLKNINDIQEKELKLAIDKTSDYSGEKDTFHLINKVAGEAGIAPSQVVLIYLLKHIVAINSAVKNNPINPSCAAEDFSQRVMDARAYLLMLTMIGKKEDEEEEDNKKGKTLREVFGTIDEATRIENLSGKLKDLMESVTHVTSNRFADPYVKGTGKESHLFHKGARLGQSAEGSLEYSLRRANKNDK